MSSTVKVGSRVAILSKGAVVAKGIVRFAGATSFAAGEWFGIELAEAAGKNDGSVQGVRYFECQPNYGIFVKEQQIQLLPNEDSSLPRSVSTPSVSSSVPPAAAPQPKIPAPSASSPALHATIPTTPPVTPALAPSIPTPTPETPPATPTPAVTEQTIPDPEQSTPTPAQPTAAPTPTKTPDNSRKDRDRDEDDTEEGESEKELPSHSQYQLMQAQYEMKATIDELTEWKRSSQTLQKQLQKQVEELIQEKKQIERKLESEKKTFDSEKAQLQKSFEREKEKLNKEKEALLEEKAELQDNFESVTLDKEFAEEQAETLEKEVERLKGQVEIMEAERKSALSGASVTEFTQEAFDELALQNEKLKEALMKLRDLSLAEKQEREKRIKELEKENASVPGLEEKLLKAETELLTALEEIDELKDALDEASQAESVIQELTDKNLALDETVAQLKNSIQELEELKEMSEELEEHQIQVEKKLRSEIYIKDVQILDMESVVANLKASLQDRESTIEQFRSKVGLLEAKLLEYRAKEQVIQSQAEELSNQSLELQSQNLKLKSQVINYEAMSINEQLRKFDAGQANKHVSLMKSILPDHFFQAYEDAVLFLLTVERIGFKSDLIMKTLQQSYQLKLFEDNNSNTIANAIAALLREKSTEEEFIFAWKLYGLTAKLRNVMLHLQETLEHSDVAIFLEMGKIRYDVGPLDSKLDEILSLMRREELSLAYPLSDLIQLYERVEGMVILKITGASDMLVTSFLPPWRSLQHETIEILCEANIISLEEIKTVKFIDNYLASNNSNATISGEPLVLDITEAAKHFVEVSKKIARLVKNRELAELPPSVQLDFIKKAVAKAREHTFTLFSFFQKVPTSISKLIDEASSTNRQLSLDQIKESLVDILNKTEVTEREWEYTGEDGRAILNVLKGIESIVVNASDELSSTSAKPKRIEAKETPWKKRADVIKSEVAGAISIRAQLMEEVQEKDRLLAIRDFDLSETKRKNQLFENQLEHLKTREHELDEQLTTVNSKFSQNTKMYEDAIASMGKDLSNLETENAKLKKNIVEVSKSPFRIATTPSHSLASPAVSTSHSSKSVIHIDDEKTQERTAHEIQVLRNALKLLREENDQLKKEETTRTLQELLPSLPVLPSKKSVNEIEEASQALNSLIREVKHMTGLPEVVSLSQKKNSSTSRKASVIVSNKVISAREKINTLIKQHSPSGSTTTTAFPLVSSQTSTPSTLLGKVTIQNQRLLPVMPSITNNKSTNKSVLLDSLQFEKVHMIFAQ